MAKLLLAGFGKLAQKLAPRLLEQGHQITGLNRSGQQKNDLNISMMACDLTAPDNTNIVPNQFDAIVLTLSPDGYNDDDYRKSYLTATEGLIGCMSKAIPIIYVSSTRVYGQENGEWIDESSATEPKDEKGKILLATEQLVLSQETPNIVVRFSGIYGNGRDRLLQSVQNGISVQRSPDYYTNRIHEDDCVGVLEFLLAKLIAGETTESIYLASDDDPAPLYDVACWIATEHHFAKPQIKDPSSATMNKRCRNLRIKQAGYLLKFPSYRDGYKA